MIDTFTVILNYPTGSRLSNIAVAGQTPVRRDDGKREQTYTRETLCLAVRLAGGCVECDERGGHKCERIKRQ